MPKIQDAWNRCAVCAMPVPPAKLMCARHWRMVPSINQVAVWRAFAQLCGATQTPHAEQNYSRARDAAIAAVRQQIHSTPETTCQPTCQSTGVPNAQHE